MARTSVQLEHALEEVGPFGAFQRRLYCILLLPITFSAIYNLQYVFTAGEVEYRCLVPECELASSAQWAAGAWAQWALVSGSSCERLAPQVPGAPCDPASFGPAKQRCTAWVYQDTSTIVAEFNLACQRWKWTMVGVMHATGTLVALFYVGPLSDCFGRRKVLIASAVSVAAAGLARSLAPSYLVMLALEFLDAVVGSGVYTTSFVLVIEMVGAKQRVYLAGLMASVYALGQALLALVAWAVPYWRTLTQILYAPSLLFIFYCFFLDESFRWLFSKNKPADAIKILRRIAATNQKTLSDATVQQLTTLDTEEGAQAREIEKSILRQAIQSRLLMTWLGVSVYCWVTVAFVYYGVSINSVSLAGSKHLNFALVSLVEIPGCVLSTIMLSSLGRKPTMMAAYFTCAVALIALPFFPTGKVVLAMLGKLCVTGAFNGLYVTTSELFPTAVRHRALAACSFFSCFGKIFAMLTPLTMAMSARLSFVTFGCMAALAALLLLLLPETRHAPLPDTVAQAEQLGRPAHPTLPPAKPRRSVDIVDRYSRRLLAETTSIKI